MGKQLNAQTGSRGRIGNIVYRRWRGMNVAGLRPQSVHNPNTQLQQMARIKFGYLSQIARAFAAASAIGFMVKYKGTVMGWRNYFSKKNYGLVTLDEYMTPSIDLTKVSIAEGDVPAPSFRTPSFEGDLEVTSLFGADADIPGTDPTDEVYLFIYQSDLNQGILSSAALRSSGTISVKAPEAWSGMTVKVYGFARKVVDYLDPVAGVILLPKNSTSQTVYLGSGTVE